MRILIITTHNANNYGAILQAYALQSFMEQYGAVNILNYENRHLAKSFDLIRRPSNLRGVLGMGKDIARIFPRYRVINKFKSFIDRYINLTESVSESDLRDGKFNTYDVYISGSDQIWNPVCINKDRCLDENYFLNFAPNGVSKFSYASSIGGYKFSSNEEILLSKLLCDFNQISVREKDTSDYLSKIIDRRVEHVLDPTLLLSKSDWYNCLNIAGKSINNEKYILLYTVPKNQLIKSTVSFYAKKLGLKVVAIDQGLNAGAKVDSHLRDVSPSEFIELFYYAEFIVTDSFHGACFSVNFQKQFVVVSEGMHANRIVSLLELTGLKDRLIQSERDIGLVKSHIDFKSALLKLEKARLQSRKYIENGLVDL